MPFPRHSLWARRFNRKDHASTRNITHAARPRRARRRERHGDCVVVEASTVATLTTKTQQREGHRETIECSSPPTSAPVAKPLSSTAVNSPAPWRATAVIHVVDDFSRFDYAKHRIVTADSLPRRNRARRAGEARGHHPGATTRASCAPWRAAQARPEMARITPTTPPSMIGATGRGALDRMLMGSVADKVIRQAPCPVLAVHHPEHEFVGPDALQVVNQVTA